MKRLFLSLLQLLSFVAIWAAPKDMVVKNPEIVNAKDIGVEFFDDMVVVYRIQRGADNIIEAYWAEYGPERIDLQPIGAFREESVRDYRPLAMPSSAYIEGLMDDNPKLVSSNVTYYLEENFTAKKIGDNNKQMLRVYADFLADPDSYPGLSTTPIPGEVEKMMELYDQKVNTQKRNAKIEKQRQSDNANSRFLWVVIAMLVPVGLSLWLMLATAENGIAVNFHSKIRSIAIVEILTIVLGIIAICAFPMVNWPWIVLGVIAILVAIWLILYLSYRTYEHIKYARHGSFPWAPALCFGFVGMLFAYSIVSQIAFLALDYLQIIHIESDYGVKDFISGTVLAIILLCVLGFWYYKSVVRKAPQLGGSFVWIAIATIVAVITAALLIFVIVALLIFKGSGKAFLQSGQEAGSNGNDNGVGHNCSKCRHSSMGRCTMYPQYEEPTFNCPHYDPY